MDQCKKLYRPMLKPVRPGNNLRHFNAPPLLIDDDDDVATGPQLSNVAASSVPIKRDESVIKFPTNSDNRLATKADMESVKVDFSKRFAEMLKSTADKSKEIKESSEHHHDASVIEEDTDVVDQGNFQFKPKNALKLQVRLPGSQSSNISTIQTIPIIDENIIMSPEDPLVEESGQRTDSSPIFNRPGKEESQQRMIEQNLPSNADIVEGKDPMFNAIDKGKDDIGDNDDMFEMLLEDENCVDKKPQKMIEPSQVAVNDSHDVNLLSIKQAEQQNSLPKVEEKIGLVHGGLIPEYTPSCLDQRILMLHISFVMWSRIQNCII